MPYWRLSSFYFFYFAVLGAFVPYWSLLLQQRGFDAVAIGQLIAILMVTKVVAPNIWGWLADHFGHRMWIVRIASLLAILGFAGMFWAESYWAIAAVIILYSFFWNASLPQYEVITLTYLRRYQQVSRYTRIRVWGSIGFVMAVMLLGLLIDRYGVEIILIAVLLLFLAIWLSTLSVADPDPEPHPKQHGSLGNLLTRKAVVIFFIAVFLMQVSHGPYYAFFSIHMENHGYTKTAIGQLWALGVLAEVLLFWFAYRILAVYRAEWLLAISLLLAALRWLIIGYLPDQLGALLFAQILHAATFGLAHAAAIHLVHRYFRHHLEGRGQALYSSISFGAGGAIGGLASGYLWDGLGASMTFALASLSALLGACIIGWLAIRPDQDAEH